MAAGWFDYDNDGWLDLFVVNYVAWDPVAETSCSPPDNRFYCHPNAYHGLPNPLFHNNGDGTFTDVSRSSGIAQHIGKGMGVSFADFDRDGYMDVFVANDSVRSFLFRNQGDGTFREIGFEAGVALREDGARDCRDGRRFPRFRQRRLAGPVRFRHGERQLPAVSQSGRRSLFEDYGQRTGILMGTHPLTGWSLGMYDFDNDGWKDLFFALSHFPRLERYLGRAAELPNKVFRNLAGAVSRTCPRPPGRRFKCRPNITAPPSPISTMMAGWM